MESLSKHTGIPVNTYTLMHADEIVAVAYRDSGKVEIKMPNKLPFGLKTESGEIDFIQFMEWLRRRVDNLQRSYMNKVYMVRKVGRDLENILRDSCALSITDQFWVKRSDVNITWRLLKELRDKNFALADVALFGNTANINWEAVRLGATSLFSTKGVFPKAILGNNMHKLGGTAEFEWVAYVIGKTLGLPVQNVRIIHPSVSNSRNMNGEYINKDDKYIPDDTMVEISLFTSDETSFVHASELYNNEEFGIAQREGQHHKYFYDRLSQDSFKRDFERILMLNWLISNHDMHSENFGCLYDPETFELKGVSPSFDHNSADFDGTIPELDVPYIIESSIQYHGDVIRKIEAGYIEVALNEVEKWLNEEQKNCVRSIGVELVGMYKGKFNGG